MPKRNLDGRVAFITGAARGQGRSHALALAEDGAKTVLFDVGEQLPTVCYQMSSSADLDESERLVREAGADCLRVQGDVRSDTDLERAVASAVAEFGSLDIVIANAGISTWAQNTWSLTEEQWQVMIDVNVTGVWRTCKAAVPAMIEGARGGAIVMISSMAGFKGFACTAHYCSAKHGLLGLMKTLAVELAPHAIRVNAVHPTAVATDMVQNEDIQDMLRAAESFGNDWTNLLDVELLPPREISNAIRWLVSEDAQYVTGISLPVDAGFMVK